MLFRRRKYLVDSRMQMRFTMYLLVISLAVNVLAVVLFNYFAIKELDSALWKTHIDVQSTDELINIPFVYVNLISLASVTVLMLIAGIIMLKKTTGPLYRMSMDIKRFTAGDLSSPIILRKKDDLQDIADELNKMNEGIAGSVRKIKESYKGLSESISGIKDSIDNNRLSEADAQDALNKVRDIISDTEKLSF